MNILDIAIAKKLAGGGGGSGTDNYNDLSNLPKINDTTLSGNKSSSAFGLQSEINSDSKLASDLVDDTNQDNKFVTSAEKTTWNGKQNAIDADHKISADYVDDSTSTNKFVTASDKETWNAKQNAIDNSHKLSSDLVDDANKTNKFVTSTEKNTWNAKQNAIDSDHKLSSSLVSFSEAEAAALASGVDSSKVGQISTNQTNILLVKDATEELVDKGAKNIIDIQTPEESLLTSYTSTANGGVALTIENAAWTSYRVRFSTIINTAYVCKILVDSAPTTNVNVFIQNSSGENYTGGTINSNTTEFIREFTATETALGRLSINLNNEGTPLTNAITVRVMICTKAEYDISPNYESHALPNTTLTPALIACVDDGAKNLWDFANANITAGGGADRITYVKTADSLTLTAVSTWAFVSYDIALKKGTYYFYGLISGLTGTDSKCVQIRVNGYQGAVIKRIDIKANEAISDSFVVDTDRTITISLYASEGEYTSSAFTISNLMICTEAAWNLSHNYESFALSNPVITSALIEQVDEGAKNIFDEWNEILKIQGTSGNSVTVHGITYTYANGTITMSGTADNPGQSAAFLFLLTDTMKLSNGSYVISWRSKSISNAQINVKYLNMSETIQSTDSAIVLPSNRTDSASMWISIPNGTTVSGSIDIMICTLADWKVSQQYEPYTLPNTELTQEVNALHERTDQIQDIARFRPAQAGWYRAFEMKNVVTSTAIGASDNSCSIVIKRDFANDNNEHHEIQLMAIYASNSGFTNELSKSNTLLITAIRQVVTDNNAYIDIYYAGTSGNDVACAVTNNFDVVDGQARWRAVKSLSAVPESATGETVIALHNFSANYDTSFMAAKANYNVQYGLSDGSWSCSTPNTYEYTGLSITVPANQIYEIQAYDYVSNANVLGLAIGVNSTDIDTQDYTMVAEAVDVNSASHHYLCRNVSCLSALGNAKTYYLFAKHETVGANLIALMWRRIV